MTTPTAIAPVSVGTGTNKTVTGIGANAKVVRVLLSGVSSGSSGAIYRLRLGTSSALKDRWICE